MVFAPLDRKDSRGGLLYRLLYYELPRGHAKSTLAAMEAITMAVMEPDYRIYLCAGDQDQAGIIFDILKGMVQRNPRLGARLQAWEMGGDSPRYGFRD